MIIEVFAKATNGNVMEVVEEVRMKFAESKLVNQGEEVGYMGERGNSWDH